MAHVDKISSRLSELKANVEKGDSEIIQSNDHFLLENSLNYFDKSTISNPYHTAYGSKKGLSSFYQM